MNEPRLGKKNVAGEIDFLPSQSLSGGALPPQPYQTLGLDYGFFVVLDQSVMTKEQEDTCLVELRGLIQGYSKSKSAAKSEDE